MSLGNIKFLAICRSSDKVVVADYLHSNKAYLPEFKNVISTTMDSTSSKRARMSVTVKGLFTCHFLRNSDFHFFVMTASSYKKVLVWELLKQLSEAFADQFGEKALRSSAGSLSRPARRLLSQAAANFDDEASMDRVQRIQQLTNETIDLMGQNIETIIEGIDRLEDVDVMAEKLEDDAAAFHVKATEAKNEAKKNNRKSKLMIALIVCGILIVIAVVIIIISMFSS
eukprot:gnl/Chilomastix_cuspidata/347.p1 GENE.gnl/Chilomastix_cuspidata/347~~gnl/Chilomastix_cuspidata/347.p1  ORF type:complete len:227 (+),score=82.39 gnl/Chilomastix_cuspidata/347:32-712(+)